MPNEDKRAICLNISPLSPHELTIVWLLLGIHTSKSSFLHSDSAAEGTTSIISDCLLANRHFAHSFLFSPHFLSFTPRSHRYHLVYPQCQLHFLSFFFVSQRQCLALIASRACDCDCDWYSLLHSIPPHHILIDSHVNRARF